MTTPAHTRTGAGAPLVLLHGIGSSRRAWDPVIPALAERFDVIAVNLPASATPSRCHRRWNRGRRRWRQPSLVSSTISASPPPT